MIRFHENLEKKENSELFPSTAYQDIKPTGTMTDKDALAFWDKLFSVNSEIQDLYSADEENLLAEIFGRYEDEFDFDFEVDDDLQTVLDRFDTTKWERFSDDERMDAIYDLAVMIGKKLGLADAPEIDLFEGHNGYCGAYVDGENRIEINKNILPDSKEVVNTLAHELRHAYQHQRAELYETRQDALYKLNFDCYISPVSLSDGKYLFYADYYDQLVEVEARAFANIFTHKEDAQ